MGWRDFQKTWHDTTVDYCDVCGNLLIHKYWEFTDDDGAVLRVCREDDVRLYRRLRQFGPQIDAARAESGIGT